MLRLAPLLALPLLAVACQADAGLKGECGGRFMWDGVEWDGLGPDPHAHPRAGAVIGRGALLGCADEVVYRGDVRRLEGVDPRVAVALDADEPGHCLVVLGRPGYLIDSAAHPAHRHVWDDPTRPRWRNGYACDPSRRIDAVATSTPRGSFASFQIRGVRPRDRRALRAAGRRRVLTPGDVRVAGIMRHGAPYLAAGDRLALSLRACRGLDSEKPGIDKRHGPALIADAIARGAG